MNSVDRRNLIKKMKKTAKEFKDNPQRARQFLVDAGIYTPTGRLRKPYRQEK